MKKLLLFKLVLLFTCILWGSTIATAQNVGINSTGTAPDNSAMLDVSATDKGLLAPRMTTTQRDNIALPATGLLIYNTVNQQYEFNYGTPASPQWNALGSDCAPAGSVVTFANNALPNQYLECDGAAVSRTTYADLFNAIGTTYGSGDGSTTFNVPDLRGEFIRGWDNGRGVDTGRAIGSFQNDELESHNHDMIHEKKWDGINNTAPEAGVGNWGGTPHNYTYTTQNTGGSETRPRNVAMMFAIKYTPACPGTTSSGGTGIDDWKLTGNASTNPASNFVGTTDGQDLAFRTNNTEYMRLTTTGGLNVSGSGTSGQYWIGRGGAMGTANATYAFYAPNSTGSGLEFGIANAAQMVMDNQGRIGMGISSPSEKLHVSGNSLTSGTIYAGSVGATGGTAGLLEFGGISGSIDGFSIGNNLGGNNLRLQANSTPASAFMVMDNYGKIGIGNAAPGSKLTVGNNGDGTVAVANAWTVFSDGRWKENIETIDNGLEKIMALRGVTYDWKETGRSDIGFVAQEIEKVLPLMVQTNSNGYKSVDYSRVTSVLVEAVKEQQLLIEELKEQNSDLLRRVEALEAR